MQKILTLKTVFLIIIFLYSCANPKSDLRSDKELFSFDFTTVETKVTISGSDIGVFVPFGTDAEHLTAVFSTNGTKVLVEGSNQTSGVTENNFLGHDVYYHVIAEDDSEQIYRVTVTVDPKQTYQNLTDVQYYGSDDRNRLDILLPEDRYYNTPVLIFMHGGYWTSGSKSDFSENYRKNFTNRGYACASINYRYANQTTVTYVQIMEDIRHATEYIASQTDAWKISANKFVLIGYSAGAVNAALFTHGYNNDNLIKSVVCFSGAYDLTDPDLWTSAGKDNLLKFTGDEAHMGDASPQSHLRDVPTLIFHGEKDTLILPGHAAAFNTAMDAHAVRHDYVIIADEDHSWDFSAPAVLSKIFDWLSLYLD